MRMLMYEEGFNQKLSKAVEHYRSLFTLPSYGKIIAFLLIVCIFEGLIISPYHKLKELGFLLGIFLGVIFFIITLLSNYVFASYVLKGDKIYNVRRLSGLSLFCWILWIFPSILGLFTTILTVQYMWMVKFSLLGFSTTLILRLTVLYATSPSNLKKVFIVSILQPYILLILITITWISYDIINFTSILNFSVLSLIISLASSFSFLYIVNLTGKRYFGETFLPMFKAFLLNWIADLNEPLENFLEKFGEERDIEVSIIRFKGKSNEAFVIVPSVHPGPFKNIGGSALPSTLKKALEERFSCIACVPLGLVSHDLDLTSQYQLKKLVNEIINSADIEIKEAEASPFIKVKNEVATACCQIFGDNILMSLSLAPNTTEDLPRELNMKILKEAEKLGFKHCILINAHNSLNCKIDSNTAFEALERAAIEALKRVVSMKRTPFKMGVAHVMPKEFNLKEGMGPGGITVIVFEVDSQRSSYIVIDGNNMISGLREKILDSIKSIGIDEGEVFTTDTHIVTALTLSERGYHPIGEVMDQGKLTEYIVDAAKKALENLEYVKVGFESKVIQKVKVIGREPMEKLCIIVDDAVKIAKRTSYPIFGTTILLLTLILLTLI
ncbi:MAG: DUF2070 family protein [Candidatus Methanomethylicia archaeon]